MAGRRSEWWDGGCGRGGGNGVKADAHRGWRFVPSEWHGPRIIKRPGVVNSVRHFRRTASGLFARTGRGVPNRGANPGKGFAKLR